MINRILETRGEGRFLESEYFKEPPSVTEIEVRSILTGVCRSDIDMMVGKFGPLPLSMQGHEGLGVVTQVGRLINDIEVGDFVATRGEPAYADFYNCRYREYVKVPEASPKYIIEPVACALNIAYEVIDFLDTLTITPNTSHVGILILGSGFLANIVNQFLLDYSRDITVTAVGTHFSTKWPRAIMRSDIPIGCRYSVVVDLSSRTDIFELDVLMPGGLLIMGSQKDIITNFSKMLWNSCTVRFPSPRSPRFYDCMVTAVEMIKTGRLNVDHVWTHSYSRDRSWANAFSDGLHRPAGYVRGYIDWRK